MKWVYTVKEGTNLRQLINDKDDSVENAVKILESIRKCCEEILKKKEFEDNYELNDLYNLLDGEVGQEGIDFFNLLLNDKEEAEDYAFETLEGWINDRLTQFYDVCNDLKIFIAL